MNLKDVAQNMDNNFDFLRFVAATAVLFGHCFPLLGLTIPTNLGLIIPDGVLIFFIISGFLITKSWQDKPNLMDFFKKRVLRIFPALIVVVLFAAFIIGPIVTSLSVSEYFSNVETYKYLKNFFLIDIFYNLPGVFTNNPYPNAVNGCLWTLPVEFMMYFLVAIFGFFNLFNKKFLYPTILLILFFMLNFIYIDTHISGKFLWVLGMQFSRLGLAFFIGSLFYQFREKIPLNLTLFISCLILYCMGLKTNYIFIIQLLTVPYLVLFFAYAKIPYLNKWGKYGDFSYGIYIYGFLIQQTLVNYLQNYLSVKLFFALAFIISLTFAILSWNLVEKPALKLKKIPIKDWGKQLQQNIFFHKGAKSYD